MPNTISAKLFQQKLLAWFDQHGRKDLPWQDNKTPYRVWVSEIMLQQTQVSTVIPYFERFMQSFPDLKTLANADIDAVLHHWAGLGYYSRARNLHRAAQFIQKNSKGRFPDTLEELVKLPGIGRSTAGAILSIAMQKPTPILDGNVKRVLTRLHGIKEHYSNKKVEEKLWQLAMQYTPTIRGDDYTQAIMDLGATLCSRSKPNCTECPMKKYCIAFKQDLTASIPAKKTKKQIPVRQAVFVIVQSKSDILLQKRSNKAVWQGLWSLPEIAGLADDISIRAFCRQQIGVSSTEWQVLPTFRHTFSHYHLEIQPILLKCHKKPRQIMEGIEQIWYNLSKPQALGLPKPVQMIIKQLEAI